jgi:hypothetical protein
MRTGEPSNAKPLLSVDTLRDVDRHRDARESSCASQGCIRPERCSRQLNSVQLNAKPEDKLSRGGKLLKQSSDAVRAL